MKSEFELWVGDQIDIICDGTTTQRNYFDLKEGWKAALEWVLGGTDLNWIDTNTVRAGITKELEKLNE